MRLGGRAVIPVVVTIALIATARPVRAQDDPGLGAALAIVSIGVVGAAAGSAVVNGVWWARGTASEKAGQFGVYSGYATLGIAGVMVLFGDGDEAVTLAMLSGVVGATSLFVGRACVEQAREREKEEKQTAVLKLVPGYNPDGSGLSLRISVSVDI
jgi:hypothetical protein